jgi:hypothetical protein
MQKQFSKWSMRHLQPRNTLAMAGKPMSPCDITWDTIIRAPSGRQRFNVLGALNAVTHEMITVTNDTVLALL